ncbi:MAG: electron transfer flavoprotein subunit beta/FixA family protein [Myxococcales bacterium]|nr:electron transfer flavoprotein subunit beta/FixA family protein [Myxococcales bacterium]MCB9547514.1 electron transfer flavoprotein subunit beta/FixA family protein [Myxococcales bacterium]
MKILVTAKRVTDPDSKLSLTKDGRIDDDAVDFKMNPFCEIAVEEAIAIAEDADDPEVIAVAIGDSDATKEIRTALAMGADRGILVECDEEELDSDLVARLLQKLCEREKPDLVILGKQAVDGDNNQVGQLLAEYLGWPQATFAYKVELTDGGATVQREVDGGVETVEVDFPAVLTTDLRLNEPRYASLPGIMKAKRKPLEELEPSDLGIDLSEIKVQTVKLALPPARAAGQIVKSVEELVAKLATEAKVI